LVVNLTTRLESCGPVERKFFVVDPDIVLLNKKNRPTPDAFMTTTPARRRPGQLPAAPKLPVSGPFVDKLLNIHRIECVELPRKSISNFFSSFGPRQKQGLFDRFRRT
jgi:hypothetical protein